MKLHQFFAERLAENRVPASRMAQTRWLAIGAVADETPHGMGTGRTPRSAVPRLRRGIRPRSAVPRLCSRMVSKPRSAVPRIWVDGPWSAVLGLCRWMASPRRSAVPRIRSGMVSRPWSAVPRSWADGVRSAVPCLCRRMVFGSWSATPRIRANGPRSAVRRLCHEPVRGWWTAISRSCDGLGPAIPRSRPGRPRIPWPWSRTARPWSAFRWSWDGPRTAVPGSLARRMKRSHLGRIMAGETLALRVWLKVPIN